jgi:hypothetical protein
LTYQTIPYKAGVPMGRRMLGLVLREQWARLSRSRDRQIEKQKRAGYKEPKNDDGSPMLPLGDYPMDPELDLVGFECRALALKTIRVHQAAMAMAMRKAQAFDEKGEGDLAEITAMADTAKADLLQAALVDFDGLNIEDGLAPGHLEALADNGYVDHLVEAILHLHELTGEARKNCGASPSQTSANTTATPAPEAYDSRDDAEKTPPARPVPSPTTTGASSSTGSVQSGLPSSTLGSGRASSSPPSPETTPSA